MAQSQGGTQAGVSPELGLHALMRRALHPGAFLPPTCPEVLAGQACCKKVPVTGGLRNNRNVWPLSSGVWKPPVKVLGL